MISWVIMDISGGQEYHIGRSSGPVVPRVGEVLWLQGENGKRESWRVTQVAYWTPVAEWGYGKLTMNSVGLYVEPIK